MRSICRLVPVLLILSFFAVTAAASPQTNSLMTDGNNAFMKGDFAGAIRAYQQALDAEKKQPTLDRNTTIILIDNLGTAYGITGNFEKARETFDVGVSKYPTYPMFYYDIACVYGRKKDMGNAIAYLQKATANKANMAPGEKVPDPLNDNSFASFKDDKRFVKAAKSLSEPTP